MKCPKCGFENPGTNKFCGQCGERITDIFTSEISSSMINRPPEQITDKILATKSNLEGERKVITVLFTDVVNYTSFTEKLDLEVVREIMNNHFRLLIDSVSKYEGTVDQLLGDGMVAFLGAPIAYEDHAQRACYTALAIQEATRKYAETIRKEYGIEFRIRIGLNSGPVLVGSIGNDQHIEYIAIGDTVNLASRMESAAEPGGILVSENTYAMVKDFFQFDSLGYTSIKGKEHPIAAYQLIRSLKIDRRFDAATTKSLTEFVGREGELNVLREAIDKAKSGNGQAVGIMGEPGIGKSRLLLEFIKGLIPGECIYLEGRCFHYGSSMPFRPLVDILKSNFNIREGDSESLAKNKVEAKLRQIDEDFISYLPFIYDVLSLKVEDAHYNKMENQYRRHKAFEAIKNLLTKESQNKCLILAIEDIHWIDKASEEFLTDFMRELANNRILLLFLYRPEYCPFWLNRLEYIEIHLGQLSDTASAELLKLLLPDGEVSLNLKELLLNKTEGNPLFMEEFIHALMESGTIQKENGLYCLKTTSSAIKVPDTVQGIIAGRADRLPESIKNTLQIASVIGRDFDYSLLLAVALIPEELTFHLERLAQLDFITAKRTFPEKDYVFIHALVQEVVYNSLLQKRRMEVHKKVGNAIEELYPDRLEEFSEILAYHYRKGESLNKAIEYLIKSGKKNYNRYACRESHLNYKEAFSILSNKPDKTREEELALLDILIDWGYVLYYLGDMKAINELMDQHRSLAKSLNDSRREAWVLGWLGLALDARGKVKESHACLSQAVSLAEESNDQKTIAYMYNWIMLPCGDLGLLDQAIDFGERANLLSRSFPEDDYIYIKSLIGIGWSLVHKGEFRRALEYAGRLVQFGEANGNIRGLAMGYTIYILAYAYSGDFEKASEYCRRGIQLKPDPFYAIAFVFSSAFVQFLQKHLEEAEAGLRQLIKFSEVYGVEMLAVIAQGFLGVIEITKGYLGQGLRALEEAAETCNKNGRPIYYAMMEFCQGQVFAQMAGGTIPLKLSVMMKNPGFILSNAPRATTRAIAYLNHAAEIFKECGAKPFEGISYLELGHFYKQKGKKNTAKENLFKAIQLFRECEAQAYIKQTESLLNSLM